jgi:hypothetical protein
MVHVDFREQACFIFDHDIFDKTIKKVMHSTKRRRLSSSVTDVEPDPIITKGLALAMRLDSSLKPPCPLTTLPTFNLAVNVDRHRLSTPALPSTCFVPKMPLELQNAHPLDDLCVFDEGPHLYYIWSTHQHGWTQLHCSVTKLVHALFDPFIPDLVVQSMMRSKRWLQGVHPQYGMTADEIKATWVAAAQEGTRLHLHIEQFINGLPVIDVSPEYGYFLDFHRDIIEAQGLIPFRTEWRIFEPDLELAGSIDMLYYHPNSTADRVLLTMYDWKRSKGITMGNPFRKWGQPGSPVAHLPDTNHFHYQLQLNVYKRIIEQRYGYTVVDMYIAVFHPNADTYQVLPIPDLQDVVEEIFANRRAHVQMVHACTEGLASHVSADALQRIVAHLHA